VAECQGRTNVVDDMPEEPFAEHGFLTLLLQDESFDTSAIAVVEDEDAMIITIRPVTLEGTKCR
jgi:hypothetical protein